MLDFRNVYFLKSKVSENNSLKHHN